jgi:hypothetical protein
MIDARELRIGNWVDDSKGILYQIEKSDFEFKNFNITTPIPLTTEILVKCGFYSKYKSVHMQWNIGGFYLHQKSDENDAHELIPEEQVFYYEFMYEIKYLHQLQNLYYALTGIELNYQP